jgi:hypothetical protein
MAESINDTRIQMNLMQNKGVVLSQTGNYDMAIEMSRKALAIMNGKQEKVQLFLNIAITSLNAGNIDTAYIYGNKAIALLDTTIIKETHFAAYNLMLKIEAIRSNNEIISDYLPQYYNCLAEIYEYRQKQSILEFQIKYDFEKEKNVHITKQRNLARVILFIMAVASVLLTWALILRKTKKHHEQTIYRNQLEIEKTGRENEQTKQQFENLQNMFAKRNIEMRMAIVEKLGIIRDIAQLRANAERGRNITEMTINSITERFTVEKIIDITNELYPGMTAKIINTFPDAALNTLEICICCLIICDFSNAEIALFIGKNRNTRSVENCKTAIRQKIGVPNYGDMHDFLTSKISI